MIEFGKTPVNQAELRNVLVIYLLGNKKNMTEGQITYLTLLMINHDIVRLHVPVHDSTRVTKVQGLKKLKHVVANVIVC